LIAWLAQNATNSVSDTVSLSGSIGRKRVSDSSWAGSLMPSAVSYNITQGFGRIAKLCCQLGRDAIMWRIDLPEGVHLDVKETVLTLLDQVLNLQGRAASFQMNSTLLGSIPELDSMAVIGVITALEERFGISVEDDEIDGSTFATVGALVAFVQGKLEIA
jgi:acyl carrier protein